jgi:signal peptidase
MSDDGRPSSEESRSPSDPQSEAADPQSEAADPQSEAADPQSEAAAPGERGSERETSGREPGEARSSEVRRTRGLGDSLARLTTADSEWVRFLREILSSVAAVVAVGLLLFAISGVWPPMVAVESGSMEPHMYRGDLIFITEPNRFSPAFDHGDTGVVTARVGQEESYRTFGGYGSVVVYDPPERFGSPIIHRAMFWVESGENWYDEVDTDYVSAANCQELTNCPAPHAGFITKGDNNARYDQANGIAEPVRPGWVSGVARFRVPYLGWIRLSLSTLSTATDVHRTVGIVESSAGLVERGAPAASVKAPG